MREDTVVQLRHPGTFSDDPLTEVLRLGTRRLLAQAVELEVTAFVEVHSDLTGEAGRHRIVRHGYFPERAIQTGIGPVSVRQPRVRDWGNGAIRFTSAILPRYLRRTKSLEDLLPWLYLKGISSGDFCDALAALLGPDAPGLSASTITRLKEVWGAEVERWQRRDLTAKRYVYFWVDGIYLCPHGGREAVHPGDHRGYGDGRERLDRHRRRLPGKRAVVAGSASRPQVARP